ncbi:MAG: 4Fe-4S dicluster domain-containing protein [Cellulosilyticaceae bacterium]
MKIKKHAQVQKENCVACGVCMKVCPINAISIKDGIVAVVDINRCVGCSKCIKECPASTILMMEESVS